MRLPSRKVIKDKLSRHILYKPEMFLQAYAESKLVIVKNRRDAGVAVNDFIKNLQWELRWSYNSSSCLNSKQSSFLTELLYEFLVSDRNNREVSHAKEK